MSSLGNILLKPLFKAVASLGLGNPHTPYEIELMEAGAKPVCIIESTDVSPKMSKLIQAGQIVHIGDYQFKDKKLQVYAQSDKVEDGKELYARYYNDGTGYPELDDTEEFKRVGKLLGYTDNDVLFATREKYQSPLINRLLVDTNDFRCKIRKEYMLRYDGHSPG